MEFKIPKLAERPLAEFIKLSPDEVSLFIKAIGESKPTLLIEDFAVEVARRSNIDPRRAIDILEMFAGMFIARIRINKPLDEFAGDLTSALYSRRAEKTPPPEDRAKFQENLKSVLAAEDTLGITAKALDLLTDHEHSCQSVRILTDIRHIFSSDASERPKAALVVHSLNLVYSEVGATKEIYIALDTTDLKNLRAAIERAEIKERNLRKMLKESNLDCLESH